MTSAHLGVPAVEQQLGALVHSRLDETMDPLLRLLGDHRPDVRVRLVAWTVKNSGLIRLSVADPYPNFSIPD